MNKMKVAEKKTKKIKRRTADLDAGLELRDGIKERLLTPPKRLFTLEEIERKYNLK